VLSVFIVGFVVFQRFISVHYNAFSVLHLTAVPQTPCAKVFDLCTTFFHPDFTVGPGVPPDPALFALVDYHHRSGIAKGFIFWLTLPRRLSLFFCNLIIRVCDKRVNGLIIKKGTAISGCARVL